MTYPEMVAEKWASMTEDQRELHLRLIKDKRNQSTTLANKLDSSKTYYDLNKENILEERNKEIVCALCGETTSNGNYTKHKKTTLCKKLYEKNKEINRLQEKINRLESLSM